MYTQTTDEIVWRSKGIAVVVGAMPLSLGVRDFLGQQQISVVSMSLLGTPWKRLARDESVVLMLSTDESNCGEWLREFPQRHLAPPIYVVPAGDERLTRGEVIQQLLDEGTCRAQARAWLADYERRLATLHAVERELMQAICEGVPNKQCARWYRVSTRTIEHRRRSIFDKMGVKSAGPLAYRVATAEMLLRTSRELTTTSGEIHPNSARIAICDHDS